MSANDMNNNQSAQAHSVKCPVCDNEFDFDTASAQIGDIIECPVCGANLEVLSIEPFQVESITTYK